MPTQETFAQAFQHHQAGRAQAAEKLYRHVLDEEPEHADALHLLGVVTMDRGEPQAAAELIETAIRLRPGESRYHCNLAEAYRLLGLPHQAILHYEQALQLNPNYGIARFNLANVLAGLGRRNEAIVAYRAAIRSAPEFAEAYFNFGNVLREAGRISEAVDQYVEAVRLRPHFAPGLNNLGNALGWQGQRKEAIAALRAALALDASFASARVNLGNLLLEEGLIEEAIAEYQAALRLEPNFSDARHNLADTLLRQGKPEAALELLERSLRESPGQPAVSLTYGQVLAALGRTEEAVQAFQTALDANPALSGGRLDLFLTLRTLGRFGEANQALAALVDAGDSDADASFNIGCALLLSGEFRRGWAFYEARFRASNGRIARRHPHLPLWIGQPVAGRTISIYAEQGLGDSIQFVRYAALLAQRGARVLVECPPAAVELFRTLEGIQVFAEGSAMPEADLQAPMLSLPLAFETELATIPSSEFYLRATPECVAEWKARLGPKRTRLRVGLTWAGDPSHRNDRERSLGLSELLPLLAVPDIEWLSCQVGSRSAQLRQIPRRVPIVDYTKQIRDLADTAALLENLDLLITVDTSVAHLAGALGRPVWTLLPPIPDWRWLLGRSDSPWYPSMRLFRRPLGAKWSSVVDAIRHELMQMAR